MYEAILVMSSNGRGSDVHSIAMATHDNAVAAEGLADKLCGELNRTVIVRRVRLPMESARDVLLCQPAR